MNIYRYTVTKAENIALNAEIMPTFETYLGL